MLSFRSTDLACQTAVASDYYGLGVRLGIYFVWLQAFVANTLLPASFSSAADTNTIFLLTLLIAMVNDSVSGSLSQADGLVLMHLCGGTVFGTLSVWGYRTRLYTDHGPAAVRLFGSYGSHIRLIICLAVSVYGFWFWGWGITGKLDPLTAQLEIEPLNPLECGVTYTFYFTKLRADGGIRYYYLIVCACCIAWFGAMFVVSGLAALFAASNFLGSLGQRWADSAKAHAWSRPRYVTGFKSKELTLIHKVLRAFSFFWLVFSAVTVEFTLNFNHITGVLGGHGNELSNPGQLLPFLVGLFGFITTMYALAKDMLFPKIEDARTSSLGLVFDAHQSPLSYDGQDAAYNRRLDQQQEKRSIMLRYLVAWMPWLGLLESFEEELLVHGISREGTGLESTMLAPRKVVPGASAHQELPLQQPYYHSVHTHTL